MQPTFVSSHAGSLDLVADDGYSTIPSNSWMWTEQTVAASRRRLGWCVAGQCPEDTLTSVQLLALYALELQQRHLKTLC
jgi:hypothetical protein